MSSKRAFRDITLLLAGAKLLHKVGIQPGSAVGGTAIGFFAGNMAGVYGFDAREVLEVLVPPSDPEEREHMIDAYRHEH